MNTKNRPSVVPLLGTSICRSTLLAAFSAFLALNVASVARATDYYWDTNGATAGFGTVPGTWGTDAFLSTSAAGTTATAATATTSSDSLSFGSLTGTGTVVVSGAKTVGSLVLLDDGMTLSGSAVTATNAYILGNQTISSVFNGDIRIVDNTASVVTLTGGSTAIGHIQMGTYGSHVGSGTNATVVFSSGTYTGVGAWFGLGGATSATGGVRIDAGATLNMGNWLEVSAGYSESRLFINGGSVNTQAFTVGNGSASSLVDLNSGTLNAGYSTSVGNALSASYTSVLNVRGGALNASGFSLGNGATGGATIANISGGTATVSGVAFADATGGTMTLNLSGGNLYIGSTGITSGTGSVARTVNLSGGIIGATSNWSSAASGVTMNLTNTGGGVTIKAADASNAAYNITLAGALSGSGGFTKTGAGTLFLNGANTYTGATILSSGLTSVGAAGKIGGNITIGSGASLTLVNANAFADNAAITFSRGLSGTITLSSGADTVGYVYDTVSGITTPVGTYTAAQLNVLFGGTNFAGTGTLVVPVSPVPEPATFAMLAGGLVLGAVVWNRRRRSASALVA